MKIGLLAMIAGLGLDIDQAIEDAEDWDDREDLEQIIEEFVATAMSEDEPIPLPQIPPRPPEPALHFDDWGRDPRPPKKRAPRVRMSHQLSRIGRRRG